MRKIAGYSLLEILISLCILSGGLLGFAQAQLLSLRTNQVANLQSIAQTRLIALADALQACTTTKCSSSDLQQEIKDWNMLNANLLPGGKGKLASSGNQQIITLHWHGADGDSFKSQAKLIIPGIYA